MRRARVDNLLVSFDVINEIMPICDDSGIIPEAGFSVGHFLALPKYFRFQVDPMKLCLGHHCY